MSEIAGDEDFTADPYGNAGVPPKMTSGPQNANVKLPVAGRETGQVDVELGGGGGGDDFDGDDVTQRNNRCHSDELIQALKDSAPDTVTFFRSLLLLAYYDRCVGQPIDKNEASNFEAQLGCVMAAPRLRLAK